MDDEIIGKLTLAIISNKIKVSVRKQQKEPIKIIFSAQFLKSKHFQSICKKIGVPLEEILVEFMQPAKVTVSRRTYIYNIKQYKDINSKYLEYSIHKLKRNDEALCDCLSDLIHLWVKDSTGLLKKHHIINEKLIYGYLKIRNLFYPESERKYTHEDLRLAIKNYQLWAEAKKRNSNVWFQKWDLNEFLRSNKAIHSWCYDLKEMMDKVGPQFFEEHLDAEVETPEQILNRNLSMLKNIQADIKKGDMLNGEWLEFWNNNKHLLDGES